MYPYVQIKPPKHNMSTAVVSDFPVPPQRAARTSSSCGPSPRRSPLPKSSRRWDARHRPRARPGPLATCGSPGGTVLRISLSKSRSEDMEKSDLPGKKTQRFNASCTEDVTRKGKRKRDSSMSFETPCIWHCKLSSELCRLCFFHLFPPAVRCRWHQRVDSTGRSLDRASTSPHRLRQAPSLCAEIVGKPNSKTAKRCKEETK